MPEQDDEQAPERPGAGDPRRAFDAFLLHGTDERRWKPRTVTERRRVLRKLCQYLDEHRPGSRIGDVGVLVLRAFLRHAYPASPAATIAVAVGTLQLAFRWLFSRGDIPTNPADLLGRPRVAKTAPRPLDKNAAAEVVEAADERSPEGLRDRAMLEILYGAGLRARELRALNLSDIAADEPDGLGSIRVIESETKQRIVPLGRPAVEALRTYAYRRAELRHPKTGARDAEALFLSSRGERIGLALIARIVRRYGDLGASRGDLQPRRIRETFAVHLLDGGADLRSVQTMMGHANAKTTSRFIPEAVDSLIEIHRRAHPLGQRKPKPER